MDYTGAVKYATVGTQEFLPGMLISSFGGDEPLDAFPCFLLIKKTEGCVLVSTHSDCWYTFCLGPEGWYLATSRFYHSFDYQRLA